jgi:hypothetical protein
MLQEISTSGEPLMIDYDTHDYRLKLKTTGHAVVVISFHCFQRRRLSDSLVVCDLSLFQAFI